MLNILSNLNLIVSLPTIAIVGILGFLIVKLVVKTVFKILFLVLLMVLALFFWNTVRSKLQEKLPSLHENAGSIHTADSMFNLSV